MDYSTALATLLNHAGLSKKKPSADDFTYTLYLISDKKAFRPVQGFTDEILDCFEIINKHLNGEQPSEAADEAKAQTVDRSLVYAVNNLLTTGRKYATWIQNESGFAPEAIQEMNRAVQSIELAWNFVLAGEFNSIKQEVATWID
jgi:hypothetical protein